MPEYSFHKLIPGGNPTVILTDPDLGGQDLADVSAKLMQPMHLSAEQAGALFSASRPAPAKALPADSALLDSVFAMDAADRAPARTEHPRDFAGHDADDKIFSKETACGEYALPRFDRFNDEAAQSDADALPHLQMMGGEFCVNATRSAAFVLAGQGRLGKLPGIPKARAGMLSVSGLDSPALVVAAANKKAHDAALELIDSSEPDARRVFGGPGSPLSPPARSPGLFCAARIDCSSAELLVSERGVCLARLPGISHLLLNSKVHAPPESPSAREPDAAQWKNAAALWRIYYNLLEDPASGVVWYAMHNDSYRIWPLVLVKATRSEHLETACGSASLALAMLHYARARENDQELLGLPKSLGITQPSGEELQIVPCRLQKTGLPMLTAWISGPVRLAAKGEVYV